MENNAKVTGYLRVQITGQLAAASPLHCGDGETLLASEWQAQREKTAGRITTVCKDHRQHPYIPASTLRGSLRERCPENMRARLFGTVRDHDCAAGLVRMYDARFKSAPSDPDDLYRHASFFTTLRDGVSIDHLTATAAEHLLFCHEVVPPGSVFEFELQADSISDEELQLLLALLRGFNGTMETAIGKGRSKGWGRLTCTGQLQIRKLTPDAVREWVQNPDGAEPEWVTEQLDPAEQAATFRSLSMRSIRFAIRPRAPLLVNDHGRVSAGNGKPQLVFRRDADGNAIVPGSSLRGVLRARAQKIIATIAHLHYGEDPNTAVGLASPLVDELLGRERARSAIWLGDAIARQTARHQQFFNAVDRFTGGVANSALYNVVAADCDVLHGDCVLETSPARLPQGDWWKGLLLLLLRDFMQGDLVIGWGKGRGYGAAELGIQWNGETEIFDFEELLTKSDKIQVDSWVKSLHEKISGLIEKQQEERR